MGEKFNPEELTASARQEQEEREVSVERITKYIAEKFPGESSFLEHLRDIDHQRFLDFLRDANAVVRGLETNDIKQFPLEIKLKTSNFSVIRETEFIFPEAEQRQRLMNKVAEKIKHLAARDDGREKQAIAQTLYNATAYLHPFVDGNGRTARLLYFLGSPHIKRTPERTKDSIRRLVGTRHKNVIQYHNELNRVIYQIMLEARGLPIDASDGDYTCKMEDAETLGFDGEYLQVLAAADALTEEEKRQYNVSRHPGALAFDEYKWPENIKNRVKEKMNDIRTEFINNIIDISIDGKIPDWLIESLDKAFTTEEKTD